MDKKSNILIVEDHALTAFALKASLSSQEYINEIFDASDAKGAYDILKENNIDLILMDLGLGEIDGTEAIKTIRKTVFFVLFSATVNTGETVKFCLQTGHSTSMPLVSAEVSIIF